MPKTISEKVDFLMKLTNTQNAVLGRALRFDASYISRIRNGKRGLPSEQAFVWPAAAFFAEHIVEDYQKNAIVKELQLNRPYPGSVEAAKYLLAAWLKSDADAPDPMSRLIANLASPAALPSPGNVEYPVSSGIACEASLYFGNAGKRQAVIAFLDDLCQTRRPHMLLLHSDEDMSWLYEDPAFVRIWSSLLLRLVKAGSRIKIIHTITRDANEMWEAVQKWLPLYMSGAIQPYYYPRLRDGIMRRTLFVAVDHSALISNAVQGQLSDGLNLLIRERSAVVALEQEFAAYLSLCRPLMEIAYPGSPTAFLPLLSAFVAAPGRGLSFLSEDMVICAKESIDALVLKTTAPYAAFTLKEPHMVAAIEEYLQNLPPEELSDPDRLEEYLASLQKKN